MIFYFTGTGNSKFVAEYIADHTGDVTVSMNEIFKQKSREMRFESFKPFVFVAPIYAWGYPKQVIKFIRNIHFAGNAHVYFLATMGSQSGNFEKPLIEIAMDRSMICMGSCGIPMPNNFTYGGNIPDTEKAEKIIEDSTVLLDKLCSRIAEDKWIDKCDKTPFAGIASGTVNSMFEKYFMNDSKYTVSGDCVSCGRCAKVCPVNNIRISPDGRVSFTGHCISCYSCINRCPKEAINIGSHTAGVRRYICPEYSEWKKNR